MEPKSILLKEPFKRIMPDTVFTNWGGFYTTDGSMTTVQSPNLMYQVVTQANFMQEYDPNGHKIWDRHYLADRLKTDEKKRTYIHYVERCAFPFQAVIVTKQLTHLCGNPINFLNSSPKPTREQEDIMSEFKQGWLKKNMEEAFFECAKSEKITGDCAIAGYVSNGKFGVKTMGYMNGEVLYPHYDNLTGKLKEFGRSYRTYKVENGKEQTIAEYLDVWDDTFLSTYERTNSFGTKVKRIIGSDGWELISRNRHNCPNGVPVAYKRSKIGAAWSLVQDCIDKYELAVSNLSENNKAYAFRILFVKGDEVGLEHDSTGTPTVITGDKDSEAKFLERADASASFELQLKILLQNIFTGSFTVLPPEVKSGDLPGVAIKLLYSPAVEKAMEESKEWNMFVDDLVGIFKWGYGMEASRTAEFEALDVRGQIEPYVHQNVTELINQINTSIVAGSLSGQTARERNPLGTNTENAKYVEEQDKKMEDEARIAEANKPDPTLGSGKSDGSGGDNPTNAAREAAAK